MKNFDQSPRWLQTPINSYKESNLSKRIKQLAYYYIAFLIGVGAGYAWCYHHNTQSDKPTILERSLNGF